MNDVLRKTTGMCAVALAMCLAQAASGQESGNLRVAGGATSAGTLRGMNGLHASVGLSQPLFPRFRVAGMGFGAWGGDGGGLVDQVLGVSVSLQARLTGGENGPYAGVGLNWTDADHENDQPFRYDLGLGGTVGYDFAGLAGRPMFVEIHTRFFGNIFLDRASTQSMTLYSVGVRF